MTEVGMAPERQGWFAGVKAKVAEKLKRFSVSGAKEEFYKKNAALIERATANLSPEDKQKAFAMIEQDALASAKVDVAMHWGAAIVGATVATLGIGSLTERGRSILERGGRPGQFFADSGRRASEFFARIFRRKPRLEGSSLRPRSTPTMDRFNDMNKRSEAYYARIPKSTGSYPRGEGVMSKGPISADAVEASRQAAERLMQQAEQSRRAIESGRLSVAATEHQKAKLADFESRARNLLSGKYEEDQIARLTKRIKEANRRKKINQEVVRELTQLRNKVGTAFKDLHPKKS